MDRSEGEGGRPQAADTSPRRREAARREQAKRVRQARSRCEQRTDNPEHRRPGGGTGPYGF